jgi:hypothetical protein
MLIMWIDNPAVLLRDWHMESPPSPPDLGVTPGDQAGDRDHDSQRGEDEPVR